MEAVADGAANLSVHSGAAGWRGRGKGSISSDLRGVLTLAIVGIPLARFAQCVERNVLTMKEMYVSLSAAVAQERHLAVIANNLANVNSAAFKKEVAVFEVRPPQVRYDLMERSVSRELELPAPRQMRAGDRNYAALAATAVDFSAGDVRPTSNPFDLALEERDAKGGRAFFVVDTPQGARYTRAGNFVTNKDQELTTPDGYMVQSREGTSVKVPDRLIEVSPRGEVVSRGKPLGALKVVVFDQPGQLEKLGNGLFSDREGAVVPKELTDADAVRVRQGYLEMSNVNVVAELVKMIEAQRAFASYEKAIQSIDDVASRVISGALSA